MAEEAESIGVVEAGMPVLAWVGIEITGIVVAGLAAELGGIDFTDAIELVPLGGELGAVDLIVAIILEL